jgi:flagellar hook-length control protein FliK
MMAADLQAIVAESAPLAASGPVAAAAPTVATPRAKSDKDQSPGTDATGPDLAAALAAMAFMPWPVSSPTAPANAAAGPSTQAAVAAGGADTAITAAAPKAGNSPAALVDTAVATPTAIATTPATDAAAPVLAALLTGHDTDKSTAGDAGGKSAAPQTADALVEIATAFTPISRTAPQNLPVMRTVAVPVHDPRWPQAIAAEVRWCTDSGVQSATLRLVPDNLGPMEMHVDIKDNQVNVNFGAANAETRHALEQSLPRLRELLAGSGLSLGQASVQQEARRESQNPVSTLRGLVEDPAADSFVPIRISAGLLDEYA